MMKYVIATVACVFVFSACTENEQVDARSCEVMSQTEKHLIMTKSIDSLETIVYKDTFGTNKEAANQLLQQYSKFAETFPGDKEKSPEFLYKAGALSRGAGLPLKAIRCYDQFLKKYPANDKSSEVSFLIAFTYDADMNEINLAKEAYQDVVMQYPGDHWALQATQRLKTIDMSDEELVQFFMKKDQESAL